MSLSEIKAAVHELSQEELAELTAYIFDQAASEGWDQQMEEDAAAGKLDFLIEQADRAERHGDLRDWPTAS